MDERILEFWSTADNIAEPAMTYVEMQLHCAQALLPYEPAELSRESCEK